MNLIAEYKPKSPHGPNFDHVSLEAFMAAYADSARSFSIHVTEPWGGSWTLLDEALTLTTKPILAKGVLSQDDIGHARARGVQPLLIQGRNTAFAQPGDPIEVSTALDIADALCLKPGGIVVNARNISTGEIDYYLHRRLRSLIPDWTQSVAASGLTEPRADYDLSLIGTALMEAM